MVIGYMNSWPAPLAPSAHPGACVVIVHVPSPEDDPHALSDFPTSATLRAGRV